jgi:hypothetical protein
LTLVALGWVVTTGVTVEAPGTSGPPTSLPPEHAPKSNAVRTAVKAKTQNWGGQILKPDIIISSLPDLWTNKSHQSKYGDYILEARLKLNY